MNLKKICCFGWCLYSILHIILQMKSFNSATVLETERDDVMSKDGR